MQSPREEARFLQPNNRHDRCSSSSYELTDNSPMLTGTSSPRTFMDQRQQQQQQPPQKLPHVEVLSSQSFVDGGDDDGEGGSGSGSGGQEWKLHWLAPASMIGFLLLGIGFALAHHFYWSSLDGTVVPSETDQEWSQRLGIAAAFIAQSTLKLAVGVAYTQRLWVSVKRRAMTLGGLDHAFSLQTDIFAFFSREVVSKAKLLCLLGLVAWCIPISSTFSSATLSVRSGMVTNVTQVYVPVPNYANNTPYWGNYEGVGRLESATPAVTRVASATSTSMQILAFSAPFPNSSYSIDFYGPAFRCQNLSAAILDDDDIGFGYASSLQDAFDRTMNETFGTTLDTLYAATNPASSSNVRMNSHLFVVTDYYAVVDQPGNNYSCHLWNTSYVVDFTFSNGEQSTDIRELNHVAPLNISANEILTEYATGETQYWTLFSALMDILETTIGWGSTGSMIGADSALLQSGLAACPEIASNSSDISPAFPVLFSDWMCRAGDVPGAIEDLSHNLTLSLLSSALLSTNASVPVKVHTAANFYTYNWRELVVAYAIAVAAALLSVGVGMQALLANGYSAGASFSNILLTTRNPDLDQLAQGHCLGAKPLAGALEKTVLRFGMLNSQPPCDEHEQHEHVGGHAAFGLQEDVRALRKGEKCW